MIFKTLKKITQKFLMNYL